MDNSTQSLRVAAVQAAPVLFDREGTLERVASWTARAARAGARLVRVGALEVRAR
jgi:nitrilase